MGKLTEALSLSHPVSSSGCSSFDVFINFRGEDTRKNFTGFLHRALKNSGVNDFIDSQNLWVGEAIGPALLEAIQGSKISIPIFSRGYACSKWCLLELSQICECHISIGQMILPIFLDVEPSHVRNQTGSFEGPFKEHEKNFEPHTVESWRKALRMVGELKGWVLEEDTNGDQAELVELVVKRVWDELISSTRFADECKHPIGIDSHVNDLVSLLEIHSDDVQFVGICGFGGIGKTTIAKALYNHILLKFTRCCFLQDVREQAIQHMGLASLQKQLLKDIFRKDFDIVDYQRGKKIIEKRLCKENALLVLDDVDNQEQVNALAGELNWFGPGSRVIITTRDECILDVAKVEKDKIYRPHVLNFKQSLQLFCLHAFSSDQPPEDYMQLSQEVACYSGGLPLTLKVLGSYFSDISSKKIWKSTLRKLKKIPHEEVQRRLRISYDNLEDNYQKAIFLDIACFFIGWETETVILIWEACGYHPKSALYRLIKRSLLILEDNFLRMHDQIRDMGRNLVLEEDFMVPSKRSRLWSKGEILEVLEGYKGTDMIKGMMLPASLPRIRLCNRQFKMMHNLKYLDISHANYKGDFSCLPFGLIFFKWFGCRRGHILPNDFYHKGLVYLNLSKSKIAQAWNVGPHDQNERFQKLKLLDLKHCEYLSTSPDFSWFPSLVQLDLEGCHSLDKLDESIGQLRKLRSLNLCSCWKLKELPMSIGDLKSLKKLDLSKITEMGELPDNISRLSSLKELNLQSCNSLKKLPDSIGNLKSLVELDLSRIEKMEELPDTISQLNCLKKLAVRSCHSLKKLPKSIGYLTSLVELQLFEASRIEELPDGVGQLEKLEVLNAALCYKLFTLPVSMVRMCCLRDLQLEGTRISHFPFDISHLKNLKQLNLGRCGKLEYLSQLPSSLVVLDCDDCGSLVRLPDLSRLKNLTTLKLSACEKLAEIPGLEGLESLEYLSLLRCFNLTYTSRRICGQGTLLFHKSQKTRFSLSTDDGIYNKALILCIVLKFPFLDLGLPLTFDFMMVASIHQKDKRTGCFHSLRIEVVNFNTHVIFVHHFEGFDWFGIPLQGKDAIEILDVSPHLDYFDRGWYPTVKLVEVLFENREPGQRRPNDQYSVPMMVADFFNWSYVDSDVGFFCRSQTCSLEEVEGSNSIPREEGEIDKTSLFQSTQEEERNVRNASGPLLEFLSRVSMELQNDDEQYQDRHIEQ